MPVYKMRRPLYSWRIYLAITIVCLAIGLAWLFIVPGSGPTLNPVTWCFVALAVISAALTLVTIAKSRS